MGTDSTATPSKTLAAVLDERAPPNAALEVPSAAASCKSIVAVIKTLAADSETRTAFALTLAKVASLAAMSEIAAAS